MQNDECRINSDLQVASLFGAAELQRAACTQADNERSALPTDSWRALPASSCHASRGHFATFGRNHHSSFIISSEVEMMKPRKRKNGTETSAFGSPGRIGHDSTKFYNSRLYEGQNVPTDVQYKETSIDPSFLNKIYCKSSETMEELPEYSIHLMVTSPPYNVTKEYDDDLSLDEYRSLLRRVWKETYRVLVTGGRACVNIANLGRKPYIPLHSYIIEDMAKIGFLMRGEIIWNKASSSSPSTAWGSWQSAANPTLRDIHEYILVFSKESFNRQKNSRQDTINREEFLEFTKSVWTFGAESAKKVGHPAPFPIDLPYRLIQLYTFKNEIVLDPFMGSGSTGIAALKAERRYVGYEINKDYTRLAEQRIKVEAQNGHAMRGMTRQPVAAMSRSAKPAAR